MPPPATPSPHRFFTPTTKRHDAPQPSSLRIRRQALESSSSQFAPRPRFSVPSLERSSHKPTLLTQSSPLIRHPPIQYPTLENIESSSDHEDSQEEPALHYDSEDEMLLDAYDHPPQKRRRLTPSPPPRAAPNIQSHCSTTQRSIDTITISSSPLGSPLPALISPPIPSPHVPDRQTPHFLPTRFPPSSPPPTHTATRPAFRLPAPEEAPPPPLPIFSPTRRSQKYIPSGLASAALSFIISTAQAAKTQNMRREEGWDINFRVREVGNGAAMRLVRDEREGGWVLLGKVGDVRIGGIVGLRRPIWDVEVGGERWGVGVEWEVLGGEQGGGRQ